MPGQNFVQGTAKILVDAGKSLGKFEHMWRYVGYDEINYTSTPNGKATLRKIMRFKDAPYYVRAHHLLCTGNCRGIPKWGSTNIYIEDEKGIPVYSWKITDEIFDTYWESNCKPFVELGFMPLDLADTRDQPSFLWWYGSWSSPPKDYRKWFDLIVSLVRHCVDRYGSKEVKTWYWEVWNEPDIEYYWKGTIEEYCKLYDYTAAAVENAFTDARIGGPAATGPKPEKKSVEWLDRFLGHCANGTNYYSGQKGTRLDFISFHAKGGGYRQNIRAEKQLPSVKRLLSQVKLGLDIVEKYPSLKGVACVLSECDPDGMAAYGRWDNANLNFRNTEYYPSFVMTAFKNLMDMSDHYKRELAALTWAFMFEGERTFEGTRTLTTNGIDKPILNLFRMCSHTGDTKLYFTSSNSKDPLKYKDDYGSDEEPTIDGFATISKNSAVEILIFCHHDDWDVKGKYNVQVEVKGLPFIEADTTAILTHYRLDQKHSNAYAEWVRQGRPNYPNPAQIKKIRSRQRLELYEPRSKVSVRNGQFRKTIVLPVHGISLLILSRK